MNEVTVGTVLRHVHKRLAAQPLPRVVLEMEEAAELVLSAVRHHRVSILRGAQILGLSEREMLALIAMADGGGE